MDLDELKNRFIVFGGVIVCGILLLLLDSIGAVSGLYNVVSVISVPARIEIRKISVGINDWLGVVSRVASLRNENESLKQENKEMLEKISELNECQKENDIFRNQLGPDSVKVDWMLEGRVVGDRVIQDSTIQINQGSIAGVEEGDIVISGGYAIGMVVRTDSKVSKVVLITSPSSNIPARGQKGRAEGLIIGDVGFILKMVDILPDEKIDEGEVIVTSGINSEYPVGLILGLVTSVENNPAQATQEALIKTQIDFTKLDYIFVIKGQKL
ncbi:MAG: rod shape-determining protein MreC [Candidatus Dojkabacteria bacterium]|jgi:rod shape-determining protein MreC|nr:rod shape-determining protein MreC [Candidatus Dojkabacteria bacterium]